MIALLLIAITLLVLAALAYRLRVTRRPQAWQSEWQRVGNSLHRRNV